jgi:hypothetical protein
MSRKLELAPNLSLPIEAVTKKFGFFGQNGSGKTYGAMKLAELMLGAGGQIVVIDPVGKWYGLRLAANGKDPSGIKIPVLGGLHGDIPLESTGGELIADVIVDRGISAVLDVSQFDYDAERARFMEHFARRLFNRKKAAPSAIHIFLEEAQEWLPMQPNKGEEKMLREILRWGKIGRNHGFGWSLITPRPQEITTKARNLSEVVLAFQTNGTHERKAIAEWVKEKGEDTDVIELLPKLKPGFAHAWSPSWLEFSGTIHINKKETFDASATPVVGAKAVEAKPLGSIDLAQLQKAMAATIEKRKAEDPAELKKQLAAANGRIRQLEKMPTSAPAKVVEKPVVDQAAVEKAVARVLTDYRKLLRPIVDQLQRVAIASTNLPRAVGELATVVNDAKPGVLLAPIEQRLNPSSPGVSRSGNTPERRADGHAGRDSRERPAAVPLAEGLTSSQQKILDEIAQLHALGVERPTIKQVAVFCGVSHTTGSFLQNIRDLANAGYINRNKDGVEQDELGRQYSHIPKRDGDLAQMWLDKLDGPQSKMLKTIIDEGTVSTEGLAALLGVSPSTGSYLQNLRDLRSYGVIDWEKGIAQPSELLR